MDQNKFDKLAAVLYPGDCLIVQLASDRDVKDNEHAHVAMYYDKDKLVEYYDGGAAFNKFAKYCEGRYRITVLRIVGLEEPQANMMKNAASRSVFDHEKFGLVAYALFLLYKAFGLNILGPSPFGRPKKELCSVAYIRWARAAGIGLVIKGANDYSAFALLNSPNMTVVAEV